MAEKISKEIAEIRGLIEGKKIKKKESTQKKEKIPEKELKQIIPEKNEKIVEKKPAEPEEQIIKGKNQENRDDEIEKTIRLLKKEDDGLKKDALTEKVNKLVEETERELGKINFSGKKIENKKEEKKGFFSFLKKFKKNQDNKTE